MKGLLLDLDDVVGKLPEEAIPDLEQQLLDTREAVKADPMTWGHAPHIYQEQVHAEPVTTSLVLFLAANRLGKSECGMREVLWSARGDHPYKEVPLINVIWVCMLDFTFYEETTLFHWRKWAPDAWVIDAPTSHKKHAIIRRVDGGECHIFFKTYEQGRESFQGAEVDLIWFDEEPPEDVYGEARARIITARGRMLMTLTALSGTAGWIYEGLYVPLSKKERPGLLVEAALATEDPSREFGVGESLVPHMTREDIVSFASDFPDPVERRMRVFGIYGVRTGTVYDYLPEVHLVPPFKVPDHFEVWGSADPGFHGFAALLYGMSEMAAMYVIGEVFSQNESHADRFKALSQMVTSRAPWLTHERPCIFYVDTEDPQTVHELNILSRTYKAPLIFASLDQGLKARKAGIMRVQQQLLPSKLKPTPPHVKRPRPMVGEPSVYLFNDLHSKWVVKNKEGVPIQTVEGCRLAWELGRLAWKKNSTDEVNEDTAAGAHACASFRYGTMARLGPPAPPQGNQYAAAGSDAHKWELINQQVFGRSDDD